MNTIIKTGLGRRLLFVYYFCVYIILHYIMFLCIFNLSKKSAIHP